MRTSIEHSGSSRMFQVGTEVGAVVLLHGPDAFNLRDQLQNKLLVNCGGTSAEFTDFWDIVHYAWLWWKKLFWKPMNILLCLFQLHFQLHVKTLNLFCRNILVNHIIHYHIILLQCFCPQLNKPFKIFINSFIWHFLFLIWIVFHDYNFSHLTGFGEKTL